MESVADSVINNLAFAKFPKPVKYQIQVFDVQTPLNGEYHQPISLSPPPPCSRFAHNKGGKNSKKTLNLKKTPKIFRLRRAAPNKGGGGPQAYRLIYPGFIVFKFRFRKNDYGVYFFKLHDLKMHSPFRNPVF